MSERLDARARQPDPGVALPAPIAPAKGGEREFRPPCGLAVMVASNSALGAGWCEGTTPLTEGRLSLITNTRAAVSGSSPSRWVFQGDDQQVRWTRSTAARERWIHRRA